MTESQLITTQLGTAAAPTAFFQQDMSERMARVEQALVEIRSALKVRFVGAVVPPAGPGAFFFLKKRGCLGENLGVV